MLIEIDLESAREALLAIALRRRCLGAVPARLILDDLAAALREAVADGERLDKQPARRQGYSVPAKVAGYVPTGSGV